MVAARVSRRLDLRDLWAPRASAPISLPVGLMLVAACVFLTVGSLTSDKFAEQVVGGLATGGVFASLAVALVLIYRATEVINFAQGEMAMFSTYIAWQLIDWGLPYWGAFFATLGISFLGGITLERVVIRPVERVGVLPVVVVTIGLVFVLQGVASWIWSPEIKFFPSAFSTRPIRVGNVAFSIRTSGRSGFRSRPSSSSGSSSSSRRSGWRCAPRPCDPTRRGSSACGSAGCSHSAGVSPRCSGRSRG